MSNSSFLECLSLSVGSLWNPGRLMITMGIMYLSSYPLTIAIRISDQTTEGSKLSGGIKEEAQKLLLRDFVYIFLAAVLIQIFEAQSILSDIHFSSFKILFEIISAYGMKLIYFVSFSLNLVRVVAC